MVHKGGAERGAPSGSAAEPRLGSYRKSQTRQQLVARRPGAAYSWSPVLHLPADSGRDSLGERDLRVTITGRHSPMSIKLGVCIALFARTPTN